MDDHVRVAASAGRLAATADVPWRIKKEWLDSVAWFAALPDPAAKRCQRFATPAFLESRKGQHEHVVPRAWLRNSLLSAPDRAYEIVSLAVACNVTTSEHRRLTAFKDAFGWERYVQAGVEVVDTDSGSLVDLASLAEEQRQALRRLDLE